jgi:3-isopropylmalate/(R)-2-methylmalate dehydratase large subunit
MEFVGDAVRGMNMEERMTICNMVVEAGGKNGVCPADQTTFDYVESRTSEPYNPVYSDDDASFFAGGRTGPRCTVLVDPGCLNTMVRSCWGHNGHQVAPPRPLPTDYRFDVSKLEPVVAAPHSPDNRKLARECRDVKIDRVYIGSCTGGKTEDFMAAAKLLHGAGGEVKVPTYLVPATQKVWADVYTLPVPGCDGKTAAQIFEAAGCVTPAAPSCAACLGGPRDTFARMNEPEVCVSTTNR